METLCKSLIDIRKTTNELKYLVRRTDYMKLFIGFTSS